ncbi:MAG: hypothetical protein AVDCRST_MAG69-690, partial [uncultured Solirubrobacteraceae bacterium]
TTGALTVLVLDPAAALCWLVTLRHAHHSLKAICADAAAGMASSAPMTPNNVLPNRTATSTTKGLTATARFWIIGWMTEFSTCW